LKWLFGCAASGKVKGEGNLIEAGHCGVDPPQVRIGQVDSNQQPFSQPLMRSRSSACNTMPGSWLFGVRFLKPAEAVDTARVVQQVIQDAAGRGNQQKKDPDLANRQPLGDTITTTIN
jgi:hypothetical protein